MAARLRALGTQQLVDMLTERDMELSRLRSERTQMQAEIRRWKSRCEQLESEVVQQRSNHLVENGLQATAAHEGRAAGGPASRSKSAWGGAAAGGATPRGVRRCADPSSPPKVAKVKESLVARLIRTGAIEIGIPTENTPFPAANTEKGRNALGQALLRAVNQDQEDMVDMLLASGAS
eukprot:CAMPEP_0204345776 /NCGR_PEP_ID=MMETSP0469-20131031/26663_1 /ASSEMBLY_ACC=CAM_ASM_000384 /TAXON_ID=2969 /ORGANISM="Oxyrrhis marina" /LENGTH=177 /DNA_ID=CAMNT_0051331279 /DNA_START=48 /DNA_END=578 /DNA_ORIENTATION=+